MLRSFGRLMILLAPSLATAFPPSMDIVTYTIDDYSDNGGGVANLSCQIASGQHFFQGAAANVTAYSNALGGGTHSPNYYFDKRDDQVTREALTSNTYNRELADFVYYGGHGLAPGIYLGADHPTFGAVSPTAMPMGTGFNKWFLANACLTFFVDSPGAKWDNTFKGLKAMLGFKSIIFDNNASWHLYHDFWFSWTWREMSLMNAFFEAQANNGYAHLYPMLGLEPGCLSAAVDAGDLDHCNHAFKDVDPGHTRGQATTGPYYLKKIGAPIY